MSLARSQNEFVLHDTPRDLKAQGSKTTVKLRYYSNNKLPLLGQSRTINTRFRRSNNRLQFSLLRQITSVNNTGPRQTDRRNEMFIENQSNVLVHA